MGIIKKYWLHHIQKKMSVITLNLNGERDILIMKEHLVKVPESKLAKYFLMDQKAQEDLQPWIIKESNNRYFIGRSTTISEMVFQFLRATDYFEPRDFIHFNKDDKEYYWHCLKKELEFYGILEGHHYKHYILENKMGSFKWI